MANNLQALIYNWKARPTTESVIEYWTELSPFVSSNLFLSHDWIEAWLTTYRSAAWLLCVYDHQKLVALALWNETSHSRPFGFNVRTLHLNHVGDEAKDQIWPEYNGLLCLPEYESQLSSELASNIFKTHPSINEIDTGLCLDEHLDQWALQHSIVDVWLQSKSYIFDHSIADAETTFSKGLKAEIKRTYRGLVDLGMDKIEFVSDRQQCLVLFNEMSKLHQEAWGDTSGFLNPEFVGFHSNLILNSINDVVPIIADIKCENGIVCRHYLLKCNETLYFYLGVTKKNIGPRIKAGTYLHATTIRALHKFQCSKYDFLGGDYLYKSRMANVTLSMSRLRIKRETSAMKLEQKLKKAKSRLEVLFSHDK